MPRLRQQMSLSLKRQRRRVLMQAKMERLLKRFRLLRKRNKMPSPMMAWKPQMLSLLRMPRKALMTRVRACRMPRSRISIPMSQLALPMRRRRGSRSLSPSLLRLQQSLPRPSPRRRLRKALRALTRLRSLQARMIGLRWKMSQRSLRHQAMPHRKKPMMPHQMSVLLRLCLKRLQLKLKSSRLKHLQMGTTPLRLQPPRRAQLMLRQNMARPRRKMPRLAPLQAATSTPWWTMTSTLSSC